jgi:hypothetical protein
MFPGAKRCEKSAVFTRTHPAEIVGPHTATDIPSSELWPIRNGWAVGDCQRNTWVWGGGPGAGSRETGNGRLVISRVGFPRAREHVLVDIPDSGPLKIVNAPLGPEVVTTAQRGQLSLIGRRGFTATLDLSTDTVTLATGEVIEGFHP